MPPPTDIQTEALRRIETSVLGLQEASLNMTAVTDAARSIVTGRIGLERAAPLQTIADEVIGVAKKQAQLEARTQLRAAGKKLDPDTKARISDAFDTVSEALKDGTDNAAQRAELILDVQAKYAEELTDKRQAKIVKQQIANAKQLLQTQKKATVGFLGEMVEDFREGPLAEFISKIESNYLGKLLVRFSKDQIAAVRARRDAEVAAAAKQVEDQRRAAAITKGREEALFKIKENSVTQEALSLKERLATEKILLDTAKDRGETIDEGRLATINESLEKLQTSFTARATAVEQRDKAEREYEQILRDDAYANIVAARQRIQDAGSDQQLRAELERQEQALYVGEQGERYRAALAEGEKRKAALLQSQTQVEQQSNVLQSMSETQFKTQLVEKQRAGETETEFAERQQVAFQQFRSEATKTAIEDLQETEGSQYAEVGKMYEQILQSFSNNIALELNDIEKSGKLNEELVKRLAAGDISVQSYRDEANALKTRMVAGPNAQSYQPMGTGGFDSVGAGVGETSIGVGSDLYNLLAADLLFLKNWSKIIGEHQILAAKTSSMMLEYFKALLDYFASGPIDVSVHYDERGTRMSGDRNRRKFGSALEELSAGDQAQSLVMQEKTAQTAAESSRLSAAEVDRLAQVSPELMSPEAIAKARAGDPGLVERQRVFEQEITRLNDILQMTKEEQKTAVKDAGFQSVEQVEQAKQLLEQQRQAEENDATRSATLLKDGLGASSPGWLKDIKEYTYTLLERSKEIVTNTGTKLQETLTPKASEKAKAATAQATDTVPLQTAAQTTPTPAADAATKASEKTEASVSGMAPPVAGPGGVAISINIGDKVGGIVKEIQNKATEFGSVIQTQVQAVAGQATEIVGTLQTKTTEFATSISSRILAPSASAAQTQEQTATAQQQATTQAAKDQKKPDQKMGFLQNLFGGGLFDKIRGAMDAFKGGFASTLKAIGEGLQSVFTALGDGLKKLGDPQVYQGAVALFMISAALLAFAAAMYVFGQTNWLGALIGIVVFAAFATLFALASVKLAAVAPAIAIAANALLLATLPLLAFAASMYILGQALQLFSEIGLVGMLSALGFLAGLGLIAPLLAAAGPGLIASSVGFLLFGFALISLGLGIQMFAKAALSTLPVVLLLLAGLAAISYVFMAAVPAIAAVGASFLLWGVSLIALGLGIQMFAKAALTQLPLVLLLLVGLAAFSFMFLAAVPAIAAVGASFLLFGAALIALGLGIQMFAKTALTQIGIVVAALLLLGLAAVFLAPFAPAIAAVAIPLLLLGAALIALGLGLTMIGQAVKSMSFSTLPALAIGLMLLAVAAIPLAVAAPFLMIAALGVWAFGYALQTLGAGIAAFDQIGTGNILSVFASLMMLAFVAPFLLGASLVLMLAAPGFWAFGYALQSLAQGIMSFNDVGLAGILATFGTLSMISAMAPTLFLASVFLLAAAPGWLAFATALMVLGYALGFFTENAEGILPALAALAGLAAMSPFLAIAGIGLMIAAPGFMAFGVAIAVLGASLVIFGKAINMIAEGLETLADIVGWIPLIAVSIGLMVLLLLPLVVPMLIVAAALALFAFSLIAYANALGLVTLAQANAAIPEQASQSQVTYNVADMQIDNLPLSFPEFTIIQQSGNTMGEGVGNAVANVLNSVIAPIIVGGGGGGNGTTGPIRNTENTFRRVQERFYNAALI
jgi:hypothetical protein